jgi:shikimate dehydrogenase
MIPILGVAGRPILHSMSPVVFRALFGSSGIEAAYTRIAAESAAEALGLFRSLGMKGMNLTAPFKEEAVALVDDLTPEARELGAINCIVALEGGRALGANTDTRGVMDVLRGCGVDAAGKHCLVIGAGGAGRAAARVLVGAGGDVVIVNRTRARAELLASALGCAAAGLEDLAALAIRASVIVSTLASDALPHPATWLPAVPAAVVLDADYKRGLLAGYASERGFAVATGADWLVCQALPAFELFMGRSPPIGPALAETAVSMAGRAAPAGRKVALVGLMGAGKTRAGKALARLLDRPFLDSDGEIEADAGISVAEIFAREGESGFRARELRAVDRVTSEPGPMVLAVGGGAVTIPAIARLLKERCLCVWLHVSPATAAKRTRGGERPLLAVSEGAEARLGVLEAERRGAYASCAELLVSTEGRDARSVAEVIRDEIDRVS